MRTEVQLQGQVISSLYLLAGIIMVVLGVQNFRYGMYPLVYTASLLSLTFFGLATYARFTYQLSNLQRANVAALCFVFLVLLLDAQTHAQQLMYWLIPLGLFAYIALPLKQAKILNIVAGLCFTAVLFHHADLLTVSLFATSYVLMIAFAGTFAMLHQSRSRTLVELAIHEPVTSAYNIRHLEDTLNKEVSRSKETERPVSILSLEVDYFEQIEEMHGIGIQQDLLKQLSETLNGMIRAGDSQYFDAQQRFYLLLPCTPEEGVLVIAERIRRTIEESTWPEVDSITVSIGANTFTPVKNSKSAQELLQGAHAALAEAHSKGNNRVILND
ncbi:hypothetical protein A3715_07515 [Oleiphilus sp. HI0009]|nr:MULTISPECIES: GGDEF domain-containing protein [unclassified Oleiphilus]KZX81371.1 hypothetical protein A3715_07515 [Oleiphilus sp. HI0009]KZY61920.1 hypothetical protein A3738_13350 [Oleiphilus sp. HI0066]KZY75541.1 hypothetical protein A3739_02165 [Oleiphilus sp. HI0067]